MSVRKGVNLFQKRFLHLEKEKIVSNNCVWNVVELFCTRLILRFTNPFNLDPKVFFTSCFKDENLLFTFVIDLRCPVFEYERLLFSPFISTSEVFNRKFVDFYLSMNKVIF